MSAVVLSGLILAAMALPAHASGPLKPDDPAARPPINQPEPEPEVALKVVPRESAPAPTTGAHLTGVATWYRYVPGGAAAGPNLRKWLGPHWRGQVVTVCHGLSCVRVRLSDWCLCSHGNRVVDLDVRSFRQLAPTSAGVVKVSVSH